MDLGAPRPLITEKDSNSDYKQFYLRKMDDFRQATKSYAAMQYSQSPEFSQVQKYQRYIDNEPWDVRRPVWRSSYRNNKIGLARRDRLAKMTDSKPIVDVDTVVDSFQDVAGAVEGVIRSEWIRQDQALDLMNLYDLSMLHGTAFLKITASRNKSRIVPLGPDQVFPIQPSSQSIQDSSCIMQRGWRSISYFKRTFPATWKQVEESAKNIYNLSNSGYSKPDIMSQSTWDGMAPGMKMKVGVQMTGTTQYGASDQYYRVAELEEYWYEDWSINDTNAEIQMKDPFLKLDQHNWHYIVKPGERLYPRKRLIIYGGDVMVYDGPGPFFHGMYPYICLRIDPTPWSFYGRSIYRDLVPMQRLLNEIPAGTSDLVSKALAPTMVAKQNAISPNALREFRADRPGSTLILQPNVQSIDDAVKWSDPPKIPDYVERLLNHVDASFDRMSGSVDINQLSGKNQVPGGETIDQMRDSLQTQLRREEKFIEAAINQAGQLMVSNVIQMYDAKQRMKLLGEDGVTWQDFTYDPEMLYPGKENMGSYFWKQFSFQIQPGSLHSGAKEKSKIEAIGLASRQLIPLKELYRKLGYDPGKAAELLEEMMEEAQFKAGLEAGAGAGMDGGTRTPRVPGQGHEGVPV